MNFSIQKALPWQRFVLAFSAVLLLATNACTQQEEVQPIAEAPEYVMPENILQFEDSDALKRAIEEVKVGTFEADNYGNASFESMQSRWESLQQTAAQIVEPLQEWEEDAVLTQHESEMRTMQFQLMNLETQYSDLAEFKEGYPVRLKFRDGLMAELVSPEGLLIIGTQMFYYSNEGIAHAPLSYERNVVADLLAEVPGENVKQLVLEQPKSERVAREQVMDEAGMSTAGPSTIWESFARVTNTYVPITQTRQVWVPYTCEPAPPGCTGPKCEICYGGYYTTVTEVIGEDLTNTRVYAESYTYKKICFILCFGNQNVSSRHIMTIQGPSIGFYDGFNQYTAKASLTRDLPTPRPSGSFSVEVSNNLFGGYFNYFLSW